MLALLLFLSFTVSLLGQTPCGGHSVLPPPIACYPHKILPIAAPLRTYTAGQRRVVVIGGDRGNAGAVVDRELAQGSSVSYTTVESNPQKRLRYGPLGTDRPALRDVPVGATRSELDLGLANGPKSPARWVWRYMEANNYCLPDAIYNVGLDVAAGNIQDYTAEQIDYIVRMYVTGWLTVQTEFQKFNNFPCNVGRNVTWFHSLSTGAFGGTDGVLYFYYLGHYAKWKNIVEQNMQRQLSNWRYVGLACTFSNTRNWETESNPSAERNDTAQQQYLAVTKALTPLIGTSMQDMGVAMMQATTLWDLPEMQGPNPVNPAVNVSYTVFQILPGQIPGRNFTDWSAATFRSLQSALAGGQLEAYETGPSLAGFRLTLPITAATLFHSIHQRVVNGVKSK